MKIPESVAEYFLKMGTRVSEGLHQAGYPYCRGGVMASNRRWCRSLPEWISGFKDWVHKSESQEIIDLSIFFDLRTIYGEDDLTRELRRIMHSIVADEPAFLHHFAQNAVGFKPPIRLPGNFYLGGGSTEHAGEINLKDAMAPMVSYARLYALRYQVQQTHTVERIEALCDRNLIQINNRDEMIASYDFLMQLRLQAQIEAIQAGKVPQNNIHPGKLGYIQQELMKQAFAQISAVRRRSDMIFWGEEFSG